MNWSVSNPIHNNMGHPHHQDWQCDISQMSPVSRPIRTLNNIFDFFFAIKISISWSKVTRADINAKLFLERLALNQFWDEAGKSWGHYCHKLCDNLCLVMEPGKEQVLVIAGTTLTTLGSNLLSWLGPGREQSSALWETRRTLPACSDGFRGLF